MSFIPDLETTEQWISISDPAVDQAAVTAEQREAFAKGELVAFKLLDGVAPMVFVLGAPHPYDLTKLEMGDVKAAKEGTYDHMDSGFALLRLCLRDVLPGYGWIKDAKGRFALEDMQKLKCLIAWQLQTAARRITEVSESLEKN